MTDIHARMLAKPAFVVTRIKKNGITPPVLELHFVVVMHGSLLLKIKQISLFPHLLSEEMVMLLV
jgi:hypothetical protein